jgi:hypothetical protein
MTIVIMQVIAFLKHVEEGRNDKKSSRSHDGFT